MPKSFGCGTMTKSVREVRRILRRRGWIVVRQKGSHERWVSADGRRVTTVAGKGSATVPTGTLASIRRETGLEELR